MRFLTADYIIPVHGAPLKNGILVLDHRDHVVDLLDSHKEGDEIDGLEFYDGILCPGFVNAHCHLELSWAKGLIPEHSGLNSFLTSLNILREKLNAEVVEEAIEKWAEKMFAEGTVAVGDIVNSRSTLRYKKNSPIAFHSFAEVFASNPSSAETAFLKINSLANAFTENRGGDRASVTPHSTYSLSFELFKLIGQQRDSKSTLLSIHHQENTDENDFFRDGSGPIAVRRISYNPGIKPFNYTGKRPVASIAPFFDRNRRIQLVHNTVTEQEDVDFACDYFHHLFWCFCPNANLYIENRLPDVELFMKKNCIITLGTDSLASNHQLSILEEMKTISEHYPSIQLAELITWSTANGAEFLEFDHLGTFEKGKSPGVVLIENIDDEKPALLNKSTSRLLIKPGSF